MKEGEILDLNMMDFLNEERKQIFIECAKLYIYTLKNAYFNTDLTKIIKSTDLFIPKQLKMTKKQWIAWALEENEK